MRLLWIKTDFLHPTTKGGQIRTLEMLRCLHRRHEVHYAAFCPDGETEGLERSNEYCTRAYPIRFTPPVEKTSWKFALQLLGGAFESLPVAITRYRSESMRITVERLLEEQKFDYVVCDFLFPAVNLSGMQGVVLFQHNVETLIWRRRVEHARNAIERMYLQAQADRMFRFEKRICREASKVIAVSQVDADNMSKLFGLGETGFVPTGVNLEYFAAPADTKRSRDLVFLGSMDWMPNIDGMLFFVREILPIIRRRLPGVTVDIVGRDPTPEIQALAQQDPGIVVTGTVPDVRPYLWNSKVSIVPLRIGGGTRLKIYESMAAKVPTVSTHVGAEGLAAQHPAQIRLADAPEDFAQQCVELLESPSACDTMAQAAWELVDRDYSWEAVTDQWEELLRDA